MSEGGTLAEGAWHPAGDQWRAVVRGIFFSFCWFFFFFFCGRRGELRKKQTTNKIWLWNDYYNYAGIFTDVVAVNCDHASAHTTPPPASLHPSWDIPCVLCWFFPKKKGKKNSRGNPSELVNNTLKLGRAGQRRPPLPLTAELPIHREKFWWL